MNHWEEKAKKNIKKWGIQDRNTLLLAMMEELGELVQANLQYDHSDPIDPDEANDTLKWNRIGREIDDLTALCYQFYWLLKGTRSEGKHGN